MLLPADSRIDSERFARYVEELREFSASHQLPFGSPQHLPALLDALNHSPAFRAECTSMLRSVFYREHGHAPPEDLLMLMIVAWGGQPDAPPSPALQTTITQLLHFTVSALGTPVSPPELPEASPEEQTPAAPRHTTLEAASPRLPARPAEASVSARPLLPPTHSPEMEEIESAIQLLAIRSPDVKHYLQLLKTREIQRRVDQHRIAERHGTSEEATRRRAAHPLPTWHPAPFPPPTPGPTALAPGPPAAVIGPQAPPREDPWDPDSEFQIELRRFAAHREAERQAHIATIEDRLQPRPSLSRIAEAAELAWHRLLGKHRKP